MIKMSSLELELLASQALADENLRSELKERLNLIDSEENERVLDECE